MTPPALGDAKTQPCSESTNWIPVAWPLTVNSETALQCLPASEVEAIATASLLAVLWAPREPSTHAWVALWKSATDGTKSNGMGLE